MIIDPVTAQSFHEATSYSFDDEWKMVLGRRPNRWPALGEQDPDVEPPSHKDTSSFEPIALPREPSATALPALDALAGIGADAGGEAVPDLVRVARLAQWSNGVFRRATIRGRAREFRCYSSTGGLHHLELYFVCADMPGLSAGVYHYSAEDHTFRRLRAGDHRATAVAATGHEPAVAAAPIVIVCTSTFWRNAWRYQERAYRHALWDAGTLTASLAAVAAAESLPVRVVAGFADRPINDLVGADGQREATIAVLAVGRSDGPFPPAPRALPLPPVGPLAGEIDFSWITGMHQASSLSSGPDALAWRSHLPPRPDDVAAPGRAIPLSAVAADGRPAESIFGLLARRRTHRHYDTLRSVSFDRFSTVLDHALRGLPIEALDPAVPPPFTLFLVVNSVDGIEPGTYVLHPEARTMELLARGDRRVDVWMATAGNDSARDANVSVFALAHPRPILDHFGDRGYRLIQLAAGMFAGRLQLAAQAVDLGASAMTAVDGMVTGMFGSRAAESMFLIGVAFGHHRRKDARRTNAFLDRGRDVPAG